MEAEVRDKADTIISLDLHGFVVEDAVDAMLKFVDQNLFQGESCCRIIHGKGTGTLAAMVKREADKLREQNFIAEYFPSHRYPGAAVVMVFPWEE